MFLTAVGGDPLSKNSLVPPYDTNFHSRPAHILKTTLFANSKGAVGQHTRATLQACQSNEITRITVATVYYIQPQTLPIPCIEHLSMHLPHTSRDTVRIQVLSDLHLEFSPPRQPGGEQRNPSEPYQYEFPARAETLALLGDIGVTEDARLFDWIRSQLKRFKTVLYLSGNHEAYTSTLEESHAKLAAFEGECEALHADADAEEPFGRFVLLSRTRHDISETVTVLGCTLWARLDFDRIVAGIKDFSHIQGLTPTVYRSLHARDLAWLEQSIADIAAHEPHRRVIVMTHHAPTVDGTSNPQHAESPIGSAFYTELVGGPCWKEPVKVWAFGHTHWACDFERQGVRVVSNPKGYGRGGANFTPERVIEM
ncbi:Metallo-dependent phosphatase-like protein [Trametes maxima]|nr:Metallo-dependent phosphatase-like protein [Trametes maxima]